MRDVRNRAHFRRVVGELKDVDKNGSGVREVMTNIRGGCDMCTFLIV